MVIKQYYLGCLAHASYLIGDEQSRIAVIVDPQRDIGQYLDDAKSLGLKIRHVFLTHFHADFVAGHLELRDREGAEIHLGARAQAEFAFTPMHDGDELNLGQVRLRILETPGHTPESISIVIFEDAKDPGVPYAVMTGDTLFIGDVGRPDLLASIGVQATDLAGMLYESLHKLLELPDDTLVYPAHGAGSMCGKNLSTDTVSTIGIQRRHNYALQPMSKEEFCRLVTAEQPEAPAYFAYDAMLNRQERTALDVNLQRTLRPLSLEEALLTANTGGQLLDVREAAEFAGAHLVDSINIGLGGKFATWAGSLLDRTKPIIVIAEPGREQEAAMRLGRIGFDNVAGYLRDGMAALETRPDLVRRTTRITAATLMEQLDVADDLYVVDVRGEKEWQAGHIEGALNIPLSHLRERTSELPRNRRIVVHCASGYRSSTAASILAQNGFSDVADLVGGMAAWNQIAPTEPVAVESPGRSQCNVVH